MTSPRVGLDQRGIVGKRNLTEDAPVPGRPDLLAGSALLAMASKLSGKRKPDSIFEQGVCKRRKWGKRGARWCRESMEAVNMDVSDRVAAPTGFHQRRGQG